MGAILKYSEYSYRITSEPEPNRDIKMFKYNGVRLDLNGKKDTVRMLFVRKPVKEDEIAKYGSVEKIGKLPADFSDDKFHKKYHIDPSSNSSYYLYTAVKGEPESAVTAGSADRRKLIIIAAAAALLVLLIIIAVFAVAGIVSKHKSKSSAVTVPKESIGDLNGDGSVNSMDASLILSNYNKLSTGGDIPEEELLLGDVNNDGKADALDASMVLGYYSYISTMDYIPLTEYLDNYYRSE